MDSTKGSKKGGVRKIINICAHIFIINNYLFIKQKDRLSLYKKTNVIIIIWRLSIKKMIDNGVLWYKVYHKDKENNRLRS